MNGSAGSAAHRQIRRWVHNMTRGNTAEAAESLIIIGDDDTSISTAVSVTSYSPCHAEIFYTIFILVTCSILGVSMNFQSEWKTVWKPADLDLQFF